MAASNGPPRRVLVVEDDPDIGTLIVDVLQARGDQVHWARTGRQVISAISQNALTPDVILLDFELPDMTARDVLALPNFPACPVVLTTARPDGRQLAAELNIPCYCLNPFDPVALLAVIDTCLRATMEHEAGTG